MSNNKKENQKEIYLYDQEFLEYYIQYYEATLKEIRFTKKNQKDLDLHIDLDAIEKNVLQQIEKYKKLKNKKIDTKDIDFEECYVEFLHNLSALYYPILELFIMDVLPRVTELELNTLCLEKVIDKNKLLMFAERLNVKLGSALENNIQNSSQDSDIDPNYKVGKGHPPLHTRFQKGNKGNRKGRKKKKGVPLVELVIEELDTPVTITENGKEKEILKRELTAKKCALNLMNGKIKTPSMIEALQMIDKIEHRYKYFKNLEND